MLRTTVDTTVNASTGGGTNSAVNSAADKRRSLAACQQTADVVKRLIGMGFTARRVRRGRRIDKTYISNDMHAFKGMRFTVLSLSPLPPLPPLLPLPPLPAQTVPRQSLPLCNLAPHNRLPLLPPPSPPLLRVVHNERME